MYVERVIELAGQKGNYTPIKGLYLSLPLPPENGDHPWLYMSFVTSLDGRISLDTGQAGCRVPDHIANRRDWRLFQELAARSDCLVTTSRYLHELAAGNAQAGLPVDLERYSDLGAWRRANGLPQQPDVAVVGSSLDYRIPAQWSEEGRQIWLFVPAQADQAELLRHQRHGAQLAGHFNGPRADGRLLRNTLFNHGYRRIFGIGGPRLAHALLADDALDSLFLTVRHRIIGGEQGTYESFVEGAALGAGVDFELQWLYLDASEGGEVGQHFTRYDRLR